MKNPWRASTRDQRHPDMMQSRTLAPLPVLACDTHSHVYGDPSRYPLLNGHRADIGAGLDDYLSLAGGLGVDRTVFVQPKAYGNDATCMLDAISKRGVSRARGIIMSDEHLSTEALHRLNRQGIRGVRFLFQDTSPVDLPLIRATAARIAHLGWSLLVQADGAILAQCADLLIDLPCPTVIDHLGRLSWRHGVKSAEFAALLRFVERGGWIKLSAPYYGVRTGEASFEMLESRVHALLDAGENRVIWGMNWPHPNFPPHSKPDDAAALSSLVRLLRSPAEQYRLFVDNPARLYGFDRN